MEFLELCKKIILIDSSPEAGTEEVALFASEVCKNAGFDVELQEGFLKGKKQFNVIARPKNSSCKDEVIFQTHLDTVEPGPAEFWTETDNNPFKATVKDGKIFGLGTADVKLDFLCKVKALKGFVNQKMKRPFVLVGTYGEEMGMEGAKQLMKEKRVDARMAIIGEPSELKTVYANNGYAVCNFEIPFSVEEIAFKDQRQQGSITTQEKVFHGKAAHSSTPHLGDNAILKLVAYIDKLPSGVSIVEAHGGTVPNTIPAMAQIEVDPHFDFSTHHIGVGTKLVKIVKELQRLEREFLNFENPQFSPPHPTLNIGVLKTENNMLKLTVSFRLTPQITQGQINQWWERMGKMAQDHGAHFKSERISPSALTSLDSEIVKGAIEISKKLGLPQNPITKASGTECSVYVPYGVDCIVIGPGISIGNSHTANEHNILEQLELATQFYQEAVKRFCL